MKEPKTSAAATPSPFKNKSKLLAAFREGERWALEEVYLAYVDLIARVVQRGAHFSGGRRVAGVWNDEAAELVQETFVRAFGERARRAYDGVGDYRHYLLTICRNLLVDRARRRGREVITDLDLDRLREEAEADLGSAELDSALDPTTASVVERYVASLEPPLSEVYQQRYVLSHSQQRAAEALGLTRQQVRTLEERLREGLRRALPKEAE